MINCFVRIVNKKVLSSIYLKEYSVRRNIMPEKVHLNNDGVKFIEEIFGRIVRNGPYTMLQRFDNQICTCREPNNDMGNHHKLCDILQSGDHAVISIFVPEFGMPILISEEKVERTEIFDMPTKCEICGADLKDTCVLCPAYMPGCCPGILYHDRCKKCCDYDWQSTIIYRYTTSEIERDYLL